MKRFGIGFAVVLSLSLILASLTAPPAAAQDKTTPPPPRPDKTVTIGFTASQTGKLNVEASARSTA